VNDVDTYLDALAEVNQRGFGFLAAYGATWLISGLLWRLKGPKVGSYAALFQGMVALPVALALTSFTATGARPEDPTMGQLAVFLATGQLLVLPLAIVLIKRQMHGLAVATLATTTAVHFVPYTWLYRTPIYAIAAVLIAIVTAILVFREDQESGTTGAMSCTFTGGVLIMGAVAALLVG